MTHMQKGNRCTDCHGDERVRDDNETQLNRSCVKCHGDLREMAEATEAPINPHRSHLGNINCTTCHAGHVPSLAYCLNCHSFTMDIPAGTANPRATPLPARPGAPWGKPEQFDVIVIGAEGAGLAAAISAHDVGAKVVLLEKQPLTGGNTMLAAGGMNAAGTRFQKAKGIEDSPDRMYDDTMKGGQHCNEPTLVRILAENSAASVQWLTDLGADLSDVGRMGGASVDGAHRPSGGAAVGAHIVHVLRRNVAARKIDVRVNSRVTEISEDSAGRVQGVVVQGIHRGQYRINAKAVILAAGGFSANLDRVAKYKPECAGMTSSNQPGAIGDGLDLVAVLGGRLIDMDQIQIHPSIFPRSHILISESMRGDGAILVNREGRRLVNELQTRDVVSAATLAQPGRTAFLVFDDGVRRGLKQVEGYFHLGLGREGRTPEELALQINVSCQAMAQTVTEYNNACSMKNDAALCRDPQKLRPLAGPKFYAIEVTPGVHYTMGGVQIKAEARAMSTTGQPIYGLFAAGEVTGGVHGANRLGGNSISETITFGRIEARMQPGMQVLTYTDNRR